MQHLEWTRHGRRFSHVDEGEPNKYTFVSGVGQKNVDINGDGSAFAPFAVAGDSVKHGDSECSFASGFQTLKQLGNTIVSQSKLYVSRKSGKDWVDVPHGTPIKNIRQDYPSNGRCTAYLDFPDIQGYANGSRLQVGMEVGGSDKAIYGFRFKSPVAGTFRLEWVLEVPDKVDLEFITSKTSFTDKTPITVGIRLGNRYLRWVRSEAPYRSATIEDIVDGGQRVRIILGPYTVKADEWLAIYPDTWGATPIAADADDGVELGGTWNAAGYDGGGYDYFGSDTSSLFHPGWRWAVAVAKDAMVSSATLTYNATANEYGFSGSPTSDIYGAAEDNAAAWATATRPTARTKTTATTAHNPTTGTGARNITVTGIVQEIVSRAGWASGQYMALFAITDSAVGTIWREIEDTAAPGTTPATLSVTYTTGGAKTLAAGNSSFSATGKSAGLLKGSLLSAAVGSRTVTGQAASLKKGFVIPGTYRGYLATGQAAVLLKGRKLVSDNSAFAFTAQSIGLLAARRIAADVNALTVAAQNIGLRAARKIASDYAAYSATGQAANLVYTPSGACIITASSGSVSVTGQNVGLLATRRLSADALALAAQGQAVGLYRNRKCSSGFGSYAVSAQNAGLLRSVKIGADVGLYTATAQSVGLRVSRALAAGFGSFAFTAQVAELLYSGSLGRIIVCGVGSYTVLGKAATLFAWRIIITPSERMIAVPYENRIVPWVRENRIVSVESENRIVRVIK